MIGEIVSGIVGLSLLIVVIVVGLAQIAVVIWVIVLVVGKMFGVELLKSQERH